MEESRKDIPEESVEKPVEVPAEETATGPVIGTWDELWEQQWKEKQRAQEAQAAEMAMAIAAAKAAKKAASAEKARAAAEARALKKEEAAQRARAVAEAKAAERARAAEEARRAREAAEAERARLAEEARRAREAEEAERARLAEEARRAREAEEAERARLAEEARRAREAEEAERARLAEEAKLAQQAGEAMAAEETEPAGEETVEQTSDATEISQEAQPAEETVNIAADIASISEEIFQQEKQEEEEKKAKAAKRFALPKRVYYILIGLFSAALILSVAYLGTYFWEIESAEQENEDLAQLRQDGMETEPSTQPSSTVPGGPGKPPIEITPDDPHQARPPIEVELKEVYALNNDLVGWIDFNDESKIDLPVMQSPYDEDFYLEHMFNKKPNERVPIGALYVPLACNVFEPSDNVIIYGHNVRGGDGSMFKRLESYRDKSYWETHQTFRFDTLYERHTYQIFAVFKTAATQYTSSGAVYGYPYHTYSNFASEDEFNKFIADVKGAAFTTGGYKGGTYYETGITPQYGDKLLCLSTCEYTMGEPRDPGSRLVVMAVRID